jgi:twitching motility protein PilI
MSNKEVPQTLQMRLAERLQHGVESKLAPSWLAVKMGGRGFLLPLSQSGEIYPWTEPHPVPYTKDWFLGVANLRGSLCGVASLSKYLNLDDQAPLTTKNTNALHQHAQDRRLVAFHPAFEINTVLAVDQLAGLKSADQMTATPEAGLYHDSEQQIWQQIDLGQLAHNPQFVRIEAH